MQFNSMLVKTNIYVHMYDVLIEIILNIHKLKYRVYAA